MKLDAQTHYDYAEKLVPRAVGYSAGLLNYFFRGDIDMVVDDAGGSGYLIVNNTDESIDGTFELWYDNKNDERNVAWSGSLSIGKKTSGNNKSSNITFTASADAKEPDTYMRVFKGKMGSEENAVAGKIVKAKGITGRLVQVDRSVNGEMLLLNVYTEGGLISSGFNIGNWGIIGVRFNLSNYDEFIVATSSNEFHKFTVDALNTTIKYDGIVARHPSSTIDERTTYCEFVDGSPDDCVYFDSMPGPFRATDELRSYSGNSVIIQDFYYDSGSIKPFGEYNEDSTVSKMYAYYCGEREMLRDSEASDIFMSEKKRGIYYGAKLTDVSYADCVGGKLPQSCYDNEGTRCSYLKYGIDLVDIHSPLAIFNSSTFAYRHYRYPYGYSPACDYMVDLITPVPLPCSLDLIKTMLRKDTGQSLYYKDTEAGPNGTWYSYSSGLGTIAGRYLISNDNLSGKHIGWDDTGNIIELYYENNELLVKKVKLIGGSFSGYFDVSIKFPD